MSVNAINAADQQQRKSNPIIPALVAGTGLGLVGYGGGRWLGGSRPDLDKVFAMTDDQFTKSTEEGLKDATDAQKTDLETIKKARTEYAGAGKKEYSALYDELKKRGDLVASDSMNPENQKELEEAITKAEEALDAKKVDVSDTKKGIGIEKAWEDVENAKKEWVKAKAELAKASDAEKADKQRIVNEKLQALKDAKADRKTVYNGMKNEFGDYLKAERAMQKARVAKYKADAAKDGSEAKKMMDAIDNAKTKYTNAKSTKLNALKNDKTITDAFESVKKLFAKEGKGKTAWIAAACAAAVGLIGGFILGGSKNDVA